MWRIRLTTFILLASAALISCLPLVLPAPSNAQVPEGFQLQAIATLALVTFGIVAAVLFLLGLNGFKSEFKKTYYYICAGLVIQAASTMAFPVALYTGSWGSLVTTFWGDFVYAVGALFIYAGLNNFAKLLQLKTILRHFYFVFGVALAVTLILWWVPHNPSYLSELWFDISHSFISFESAFSALVAVFVWKIRRVASTTYSLPLLWLAAALVFNSLGSVPYFAATHLGTLNGAPHIELAEVAGAIFLISKLLYVTAGYVFNKINRPDEPKQHDAEPLDVINYMATLASNPLQIDPILDQLRWLTANLKPGETLSAEDLAALGHIYQQLEDYLVTSESLREFSRESLRELLQNKFGSLDFLANATPSGTNK